MAAEAIKEASPSSLPPPSFLEVICTSSGKKRRFAPGTKAGFALNLINNKLDRGARLASYIEAFKEGEEPICFGPSSVLVDYGNGWKLQTVLDHRGVNNSEGAKNPSKFKADGNALRPEINLVYVGKILLAFIFIFMLGGIFTFALEYLPRLMLFMNPSL